MKKKSSSFAKFYNISVYQEHNSVIHFLKMQKIKITRKVDFTFDAQKRGDFLDRFSS